MRIPFMAAFAGVLVAGATFASVLAAQAGATPGLAITQVLHEPSSSEVGPYISSLTIPNPNQGIPGQPATFNVYGNGSGYSNELDNVDDKFHAIASTTTHQLAVLENNTGADIIIDVATIVLSAINPTVSPVSAPEAQLLFNTPPGHMTYVYGFDQNAVSVPNGSAVSVWLWVAKWGESLDTSPRDYICVWTFTDTVSATTMVVNADLTIPEAGGGEDGGGCVVENGGSPTGLLLLAAGGMAAIVMRRRLFARG